MRDFWGISRRARRAQRYLSTTDFGQALGALFLLPPFGSATSTRASGDEEAVVAGRRVRAAWIGFLSAFAFTAAPPAAEAVARSVQYVEIVLGGAQTSNSANLTLGQTVANCVPFATSMATSGANQFRHTFTDITFAAGSPPTVTATRDTAAGTVTVGVYVVEFDPTRVKVQQGPFAINNTFSTDTVGVTAVDLARAAALSYHTVSDSTPSYDDTLISVHFQAANQLRFQRSGSTGQNAGTWYVFEALPGPYGFAVQPKIFTFSGASGTSSALSPTVSSNSTMVVGSYRSGETGQQPDDGAYRLYLSGCGGTCSSVTADSYTGSSVTFSAFVISFPSGVRVQRGTLSYIATDLQKEATLPIAVNQSRSMAWNALATGSGMMMADSGGTGLDPAGRVRLRHVSPTKVRGDRATLDDLAEATWEVVEWTTTTEVSLASFAAIGGDSAVELTWRTASELDNLGFHVYRGPTDDGPWTPVTTSLIPGLGSSPDGASYAFRDASLVNGTTYFYRLEDIDASSVSTFHGPVSATPSAASVSVDDETEPEVRSYADRESSGELPADRFPGEQTTYGSPAEPSFRVLSRSARSVVVELATPGFVVTKTPTGVRVSVPGFDERTGPQDPALPLKRALLDAVVGRHARIAWAREEGVLAFPNLTPAAVGGAEILVHSDGTVRPRRRQAALKTNRQSTLLPRSPVRIAGDAFIGESKKLALEMSPIRYDSRSGKLLLTRRLQVKIAFDRVARARETGRGSRGRRRPRPSRHGSDVLAHLHTVSMGLHAVSFEALGLTHSVPVDSLRLSLLGKPVPFHVEPRSRSFGRRSVLFFHAASVASSMDFSSETTYALERAPGGIRMPRLSARVKGLPKVSVAPLAQVRFETNRLYQAGLLHAPDIWLWDFLVDGMSKSFSFSVEGLDTTSSQQALIEVVFQGASEAELENEHHLSVSLNGVPLGETSFDGKLSHVFSSNLAAALLAEGENSLTLTNLGDTGAYSFVLLDRIDLVHPRTRQLQAGLFEGSFSEGGRAAVSGRAEFGLDVTNPSAPQWLSSLEKRRGTVHFKTNPGHRYILASRTGLRAPRVSKPLSTGLRSSGHQADYLVIAPAAYLEAAQPLLERRQDQGLRTLAVSFEEITSEFGHGRPSAEAIRDFLAHAFHNWQTPSVRYVLLLGDASSDPRNFTRLDKGAPLPALWVKTSYLWTSSDPTLGAVNGEDGLPDLAIGRLPATTVEEAEALVQKVLEWEDTAQSLGGKAILVADNPDIAGDFEADIADIQASFLGGRETESILLREQGANTRSEVLNALDGGASILSYVGHGGPAVWASENVLNSWDPPKLLAQSEQPFMMTFNCLNGYFVAPNYDSLAEAFLKAEGRGTIGAFSPSESSPFLVETLRDS